MPEFIFLEVNELESFTFNTRHLLAIYREEKVIHFGFPKDEEYTVTFGTVTEAREAEREIQGQLGQSVFAAN